MENVGMSSRLNLYAVDNILGIAGYSPVSHTCVDWYKPRMTWDGWLRVRPFRVHP